MSKKTRRETLTIRLMAQRQWIAEHGETRAGYLARYAEPDDEFKGNRVYDADMAELKSIEEQLKNHWL